MIQRYTAQTTGGTGATMCTLMRKDECGEWVRYEDAEAELTTLRARVEAIEADNAKLRAVAEAAGLFLVSWDDETRLCPSEDSVIVLRSALAALKDGK